MVDLFVTVPLELERKRIRFNTPPQTNTRANKGPTIAPSARSPRWGENGFAALIKTSLSPFGRSLHKWGEG